MRATAKPPSREVITARDAAGRSWGSATSKPRVARQTHPTMRLNTPTDVSKSSENQNNGEWKSFGAWNAERMLNAEYRVEKEQKGES